MPGTPRRTIASLVGEELNAVSFVIDYVEFHFNGPVLRALVPPQLETASGLVRFPNPGSRDALCGLIGATVLGVAVNEDHHIQLTLSKGQRLVIPLDDPAQASPEAATFQGEAVDGPLDVW